jgi:uncharacterized protein
MKQMLETVFKSLVDNPSELIVNEITGTGTSTVVFEVQAKKEDIGKIIGKGGRTVQAARTLLNAVATKEKKRAVLTIPNS